MTALESFAERVDPILRSLPPEDAIDFLDATTELSKVLTSEQVATFVACVRAVSSSKASAALARTMSELAAIAGLVREVPRPQMEAFVTVRHMDLDRAAKASANRPARKPRAPKEDPPTSAVADEHPSTEHVEP